ncbi:uncharacterized protein TRIVIDRAFT_221647 [Trichoderma virens Gv29-8]|uniref:LTD domain-containing protein n=1 Tax=Hypocrea virens (strain Gv29-8 / FGSC 10586) TaxID=413071 RepID=G9MTL6_HYPVG|nr:uncharacterized protein TRIVIDRAFT_221647 [Trichoderma virens Gv29-8]EHK22367.1 hypothetical protein TRIVIDRAFT_221647 [Trichoderma virens Gv29-8]UKZ47405.1 hypothetical protein TrVGV298_001623 [Trichoderma virens]
MPVKNYGVWKAKPVSYKFETDWDDPKSPHLYLVFDDGKIRNAEAAINIKSGDHKDSRLVYWPVSALDHPIMNELQAVKDGFHSLEEGSSDLRLDYIRGNMFQKQAGRLLPHDIPEENNDIIDVLEPIIKEAISSKATIYLYGSRFSDGNTGKKGIHNVHMNQGNSKKYARDNGVYQDGGFFIQFKNHWKAIFLGFASQAVHTNDDDGSPIPPNGYETWADFLDPEVPARTRESNELHDSPVLISQALVNPAGPDNQPGTKPETVSLTNRTTHTVDLTGWKAINQAGQFEELPKGAKLAAKEVSKEFKVPNCPLSNKGGVITLLNAQGSKVHGVSYTRAQAKWQGNTVLFRQPGEVF